MTKIILQLSDLNNSSIKSIEMLSNIHTRMSSRSISDIDFVFSFDK